VRDISTTPALNNNSHRSGSLLLAFNCNVPFIQRQVNRPRSSRHVPSFWHGLDAHSSTFVSHLSPVYPGVQSHLNEPGVLTHVPPCSHGGLQPAASTTVTSHSVMLWLQSRNAINRRTGH